jgi:hypothetical protein
MDPYYDIDIDDMSMKEALVAIDEVMIKYILDFLKTGEFKNKNSKAYMRVYRYKSILIRLALFTKRQTTKEIPANFYSTTILKL